MGTGFAVEAGTGTGTALSPSFPTLEHGGPELPSQGPQQLWLVLRSLLVHSSKASLDSSKMPHHSLPFGRGFEREESKEKTMELS